MKTEIEIARAHDILVAIIQGEVPSPVKTDKAKDEMLATASVLCWVLGHEHNPLFAAYLNKVEEEMKSMGFVIHYGGN